MSDYPVNIAITDTFSHYLLTTGLANAAFTKLLYKDGEVCENLFTNTSEFDNAAWTKVASSISANAVVEPLGGILAGDKIVENTATTDHGVRQVTSTLTSGLTYSYSVYAKAAERTQLRLVASTAFSGTLNGIFDLSAGTVLLADGGATGSISDAGGGWYRCTISGVATSTTTAQCDCFLSSGLTSNYLGDGASGAYIWGAQIKRSTSSSTYLAGSSPTVTEIALGQYQATFIPYAEGTWFLLVYETATSSVKYLANYPVRKVESDVIIESVGSYTIQEALSVLLAACAGVTSDSGATLKTPDGTTTRIAATLNSSNERTAITLTPSS